MKKAFVWVFFSILLIGLVACNKEPDRTEEITTEIESTTENTDSDGIPSPDKPELIELTPVAYLSEYSFTPTMRVVYYKVQNELIELCPPGTIDELFENNQERDMDKEPTEMAVVTLIKHCNISMADFDMAIKKTEEKYFSWGSDMTLEENELPNADIIYTFDNEIINAYYRRENPVAPDWLGTERAKDFTYESYSAYLEANPQ